MAPDGRKWKVGRQWLPRRVRIRRNRGDDHSSLGEWLELGDIGGAGGLVVAIAIVLGLAVIWPLVALALEIVIVIVLVLAGLAGRVVLRHPWRVVARTKDSAPDQMAWNVRGWRESGAVVEEVARALAAGNVPRPAGAERLDLEPGWYRRLRS